MANVEIIQIGYLLRLRCKINQMDKGTPIGPQLKVEDKLRLYFSDLVRSFPVNTVQDALSQINQIGPDSFGLQLLAVGRYMRKGTAYVAANWTWSAEEISAYEHTPRAIEVKNAVAKVDSAFRTLAPGFSLSVRGPRSLPEQVKKWTANTSIKNKSRAMVAYCLSRIGQLPDVPDVGSIQRFRSIIAGFDVTDLPLAAPGLSDHGQMRAVDFQVHRVSDNSVVAIPEVAKIQSQWEATQFTSLLKSAVKQAGSQFEGPLMPPHGKYEPWHYRFP